MTIWTPAMPGVWIGGMSRPYRDEFDYVLTLSDIPPRSDDGLHHRVLPIPATAGEINTVLDLAVQWLQARWWAQRTILVQSTELLWAQTIVAALLVHLGASADEAILSLHLAGHESLHQQPLHHVLRGREVGHA